MSVQITITGGDAAESLRELSALAKGFNALSSAPAPVGAVAPAATPVSPAPVGVSVPQTGFTQQQGQQPGQQPPVQAPTGAVPLASGFAQPGAQQGQQPGAVPTTTPTYTMEQLGVAAGPLVDAGRAGELTAWLNQRGAASLSQLDPAHYGDFATYLRGLGARI